MGITVWQRRSAAAVEADMLPRETQPQAPAGAVPDAQAGSARDAELERLRLEVSGCTRCVLHETRTRTVFGVGSHIAQLMIIGEAPGADEDRQGEPFVGRAGRLLNAMLGAIGLRRESVYITNIVKCRPPKNRDPRPEETASCGVYLKAQIDLIKPAVILAVGRVAAHNLLGTTTAIGRLRGHNHRHPETGTPIVVTYHPAYLLRSPAEKRKSWEDLKRVRRMLRESP